MSRKKSPIDEFLALSDAEKRKQTATFDREFVAEESRPMNTAEQTKWRRAKAEAKKRLRGRPVKGEGVQVISLSMEKKLLRDADRVRAKLHKTRAQIVAEALRVYLPTLS